MRHWQAQIHTDLESLKQPSENILKTLAGPRLTIDTTQSATTSLGNTANVRLGDEVGKQLI